MNLIFVELITGEERNLQVQVEGTELVMENPRYCYDKQLVGVDDGNGGFGMETTFVEVPRLHFVVESY